MTTWKTARIEYNDRGDKLIISNGLEKFDISYAARVNFTKFSPELYGRLCIYNPAFVELPKHEYDMGKILGLLALLPVNISGFDESDAIEQHPDTAYVKTLTVIGSSAKPAHIMDARFKCQKNKYYVDLDDPLAILHGVLVKELKGENLFLESICTALYDKIPLNAVGDSTKKDATLLLGKEMKAYKLPWHQIGSNELSDPGRSLDWSKTVRENNIRDDEVIHCQLYKEGNNLTAYGGAGKFDYEALQLNIILGILL
jgi:hypothetical protein